MARATVAQYQAAIGAHATGSRALLTVDFGRLAVTGAPGCSTSAAARAGTPSRRCAAARDVVALDPDAAELAQVAAMFAAMREAGEAPPGAAGQAARGDATAMPFPDGASTG